MGKEENADNQHFLLFSAMFSTHPKTKIYFLGILCNLDVRQTIKFKRLMYITYQKNSLNILKLNKLHVSGHFTNLMTVFFRETTGALFLEGMSINIRWNDSFMFRN